MNEYFSLNFHFVAEHKGLNQIGSTVNLSYYVRGIFVCVCRTNVPSSATVAH